jgi:uncharacterized membrane protein HdeD (DUF308 family)
MDAEVPGPLTGGARAPGDPRRLWVLLALRGVLALVFGVLALLWPDVTLLALALLFAAYAVVDGAGMVASGLSQDGRDERWSYVLAGVVGIVAGVLAALWPDVTALALVVLAGAWAVATGVLEIVAAVRLRRALTGEWALALLGALSVVAGVVIFVRPDVGAVALSTVLGTYALVAGAVLLVAAWRLRKAPAGAVTAAGRSPVTGAAHGPGPAGPRPDTTRATSRR